MNTPSIDDIPIIPVGTSSFNQLFLYGLAARHEVHHHLRTQAIGLSQKDCDEILDKWAKLQPQIRTMQLAEANEPDRMTLAPVPSEHQSIITSYLNHPIFKKSFISSPTTVEIVEVDKIVGGQRAVNLDYTKQIANSLSTTPSMKELLELCIAPDKASTPIQHLELGATHIFSSPNADLRFLGAFEKPIEKSDVQYAQLGGIPASALLMFVGYGTSSINAFHVNNRVILNNGFHRVYALRSKGVSHIPIVLQKITNLLLEMPPMVTGLQREYVCGDPRPVMIKDFFNPLLTIKTKGQTRIKVVTAQAQSGQLDVPV